MMPRVVPLTVLAVVCVWAPVGAAELPACVRDLEPPAAIPPRDDDWLPRLDQARETLDQALERARAGQARRAVELVEEAIRLDVETNPGERPYYVLRAELLADLGDGKAEEAIGEYERARLAAEQGRFPEARAGYTRALEADPEFLWAANNRAWMQATHVSSDARNGREAIPLALYACVKSDWHNWSFIDTLAAGYAEVGDFPAAIRCGERALQLAPEEWREELREALYLYRRGWPRRQTRLGLAELDPDAGAGGPAAGAEAARPGKRLDNIQELNRPGRAAGGGRPASFVETWARAVLAGDADAAGGFVTWSETPQGHEFWSREQDRMKSGQPLSPEARQAIETWLGGARE